MDDLPVLIAGGGSVGSSLALALAQFGVRSLIVEEKAELDKHSRALGILPRTLEIFRSWGIYDRFVSQGKLLTEVDFWSPEQRDPLIHIDFGIFGRLSAAPGILIMPQNRTEMILREAVVGTGLTELRLGNRVASFEQGSDGVSVKIEKGTGETETIRCRYLVGCDGSHSAVRQTLGWSLEGKTYPIQLFLADIQIDDDRDLLPWPRVASMEGNFVAMVQYEPKHWRIVHPLRLVPSEQSPDPVALVNRCVEAVLGPGPSSTLWSSVFRIHRRTSPHFSEGRVFLAGDAAHINSPVGGQGMNSGIQDAHNLAWKLARALAGAQADQLLASYQEERRHAILTGVDRYTEAMTQIGLLLPPSLRKIRLFLVSRLLKRGLISFLAPRAGMLDTQYRRSGIISGKGSLVGCRAPDGELIDPAGASIRLLDLVGPAPALVLFGDGRLPGWEQSMIRQQFSDIADLRVVLLLPKGVSGPTESYRDASADSSLFKRWKAAAGSAALVRPDGHIGWIDYRPVVEELVAGVRRALGC
jgi:2-polyprenyl-6-methoxyphenol hydroxylase-like FAD-dependent oxidoreductase